MKSENKKALLRLLMKDLAPQQLLFAAELVLIVLVSSLYQVEREAVLYTCGLCLLLFLYSRSSAPESPAPLPCPASAAPLHSGVGL